MKTTSEHSGGGEAILALARDLRRAVSIREETVQQTLDAYNHAIGERLDYAAEFLKVLQRTDALYEANSRQALKAYRERIEQT